MRLSLTVITWVLATFHKQMQVKLKEFNDNEEGLVYQIGYGSRNYYSASSADKLKGVPRA